MHEIPVSASQNGTRPAADQSVLDVRHLAGLPVTPKAMLEETLTHALHMAGRTVKLLDNNNLPLHLSFPTVHLLPSYGTHTTWATSCAT